jgi:hypothetical protein
MKALSVGVTVFVCLSLIPSSAGSQTGTPKAEKLVFENEYVKAYEVSLKPGENLPPHETGNRLIYSLTAYKLTYHWENRSAEENRKAGEIHFHPAGIHHEENSGKAVAKFLMVERTSKPLPPIEGTGLDMAKASPHNSHVLFDRSMAKVFEVTLYPRDTVNMHLGLNRLIHTFTACELHVTTPDGKTVRESCKKGSYHWHGGGLHAVANRGTQAAKFLVFAFKQ